jgi:hypothetical protein
MNLKAGTLLVFRGNKPQLVEVVGFTKDGLPVIEYDSDGSIHDYFLLSHIEEDFQELITPMVVYCWTGKSRFCHKYRAGYYYITNDLNSSRYSDVNISQYLGTYLPGSSQEEFARAIQLKAFW